MVLCDTSIWIDHLRSGNAAFVELLNANQVRVHPWTIGELALGNLKQRSVILSLLGQLPQATCATHAEVMSLIDARKLHGRGIGYVDVHLLAATLLMPGDRLWTLDQRLASTAAEEGVSLRV